MKLNARENRKGISIALIVIACWGINLSIALQWEIDWAHPLTYLLFFLQAHLYTGLFITAHDAMHGVVSSNQKINHGLGRLCATLFAFNFYGNLFRKHHLHHQHVATDEDPDYHHGSFWPWYWSFTKQYVNLWQVLLMAVTFNLLILVFPEPNVLLYWAIPSIVATFQLFYFGTYIPHRGEHAPEDKYKSKSLPLNHVKAFLTCYFFGYHYEHHASPGTPWWKLYEVKERSEAEFRQR